MRIVRTSLLILCVLAPALGRAGVQQVPCEEPFVFGGADVNVVVLPFSFPRELRQNPAAGERLGLLVQREALLSIAKFGRVGAVQLVENPNKPCQIDTVRAQLLGELPGARAVVQPGNGLVLVWGRFLESGGRLHVQAYVHFLRRGITERVEVRIGGERLVGELSAQGFAGPLRQIGIADLGRIEEQSLRAATLYERDDTGSRKTEIPAGVPFYYFVTEIKGDWMRVATFTPDNPPPGQVMPARSVLSGQWMKARAADTQWSLRAFLPEMAFVEGITGYLGVRIAMERSGPQAALASPGALAALEATDRLMKEYREAASRHRLDGKDAQNVGGYAMAEAVPLQIQGFVRLLRPEPAQSGIDEARRAFTQASWLLPASADARNLKVMSELLLAYRGEGTPTGGTSAATTLLDAVGLEPDNTAVVRNLKSTYRLLLLPRDRQPLRWAPLDDSQRAQALQRLDMLNAVVPAE